MSDAEFKTSPLMLIGVGGAGSAIATGVCRAYSGPMRMLAVDTDARSGGGVGAPFLLLGGNRLAGAGAGGNVADARSAVHDELELLDSRLTGVRTAVVVAGLGGGTGGGVSVEIIQYLRRNGIATLLFATMPFGFEGDQVCKRAMSVRSVLESEADVSVFLPLDRLVGESGSDNMKEAMRRGVDTLASGVTLLWRLLERPGYISLDSERLNRLLRDGGPARFVTAGARGEKRAEAVVDAIKGSPFLDKSDAGRTRAVLVGVLAGDDLRLSEVGTIATDLQLAFSPSEEIAVGTVNDEETFSGRIAAVALVFGENRRAASRAGGGSARRPGGVTGGAQGLGRFRNVDKTVEGGEDLDMPTYLRMNITLDR